MSQISRITLPSGNTYDIKDSVARSLISSGVTFIVAWNGAEAPTATNIPAGVVVTYNNVNTTGTLTAANAVSGAFYLVKSSTTPSNQTLDIYDQYVVIKPNGSDNTTWFWEKIGDTQINLTNIVTGVSFTKQTDSVIGADSTFTITQPTVGLSLNETTDTGRVSVVTDVDSSVDVDGSAVQAITGFPSLSTNTFLTGVAISQQPTTKLVENGTTATGRITYVKSIGNDEATTKLSAVVAQNGEVGWDSQDVQQVVTGYNSPQTQSFLTGVTTASSKLTTTTIRGVQSTTTTASKAQKQSGKLTTVTGFQSSQNNANILANVSISGETLQIGAVAAQTVDTDQYTFQNVDVPVINQSATTVATGALATTSSGASVITGVTTPNEQKGSAITGFGTPTKVNVVGTNATFVQPTIQIQSSASTGDVTVVTGMPTVTTKYLSVTKDKDLALSTDGKTAQAITGLGTPSTSDVISSASTLSVTQTKKYLGASAQGANTEWNSKDSVTVLTDSTSLTVTKGS